MNLSPTKLCSICEKHKTIGDFVLLEEEGLILSHWPPRSEEDSVYQGYCFIEPREHLTHLLEMTNRQSELVGLWTKKLDKAFSEVLNTQRTYYFKFADLTPHVHVHVYPRHLETPEDVVGEAVRHWKGAPKMNRSESVKFCGKLKEILERC